MCRATSRFVVAKHEFSIGLSDGHSYCSGDDLLRYGEHD